MFSLFRTRGPSERRGDAPISRTMAPSSREPSSRNHRGACAKRILFFGAPRENQKVARRAAKRSGAGAREGRQRPRIDVGQHAGRAPAPEFLGPEGRAAAVATVDRLDTAENERLVDAKVRPRRVRRPIIPPLRGGRRHDSRPLGALGPGTPGRAAAADDVVGGRRVRRVRRLGRLGPSTAARPARRRLLRRLRRCLALLLLSRRGGAGRRVDVLPGPRLLGRHGRVREELGCVRRVPVGCDVAHGLPAREDVLLLQTPQLTRHTQLWRELRRDRLTSPRRPVRSDRRVALRRELGHETIPSTERRRTGPHALPKPPGGSTR